MKIALISAINNPTKQPFEGGIPAQVWWTATKLIERGHDVTLFASGDSDPDLPLFPIIEKSIFSEDKYRHADRSGFFDKINRFQRSLVVKQAYHKLSETLRNDSSFDIIHNNALHHTPLLHAASYKAPMITTLHTPPFKEIAKGVKLAAQRQHSHFVTVSNALIRDWDGYDLIPDVIYNGIDISKWAFNETPKKKTAIWFGRITPQKAPHMAVQAAREAGYKLKLFGNIVDETYFNEQVKPLLSPPNVDYYGVLSHQKLAKEIGQASVMINTPQWEEPFGLTYIEAMACGTPVATFKSGASEEILTDKTGVIVPKDDVDGLADALDQAANLKRADCHKHVEKNFTIDRMIEAYEACYKKILS